MKIRLNAIFRGFLLGLAMPLGLLRCVFGRHQTNKRDWGDPNCIFCGKEIR